MCLCVRVTSGYFGFLICMCVFVRLLWGCGARLQMYVRASVFTNAHIHAFCLCWHSNPLHSASYPDQSGWVIFCFNLGLSKKSPDVWVCTAADGLAALVVHTSLMPLRRITDPYEGWILNSLQYVAVCASPHLDSNVNNVGAKKHIFIHLETSDS